MRALALAVLLLASPAAGHEFYSKDCCDDKDCRPAADGEVRETADGYVIQSMKTTVPFNDKRIRYSPDGRFHVCPFSAMGEISGSAVTSRLDTRCLYVPARTF